MPTETPTNGETPQAVPAVQPVEQQPAPPVQQPASEPTEEPFDAARAMRTISNLREIEKQAKKDKQELEALRAEQQKRADAELSETDRLRKQATEAAAKVAQLQADIWRRDVATETGIPSILVDRIQGATKEDMLADAKRLAEALPKKSAPGLPATNPGNANPNETEAQKRARLFGGNADPFTGGGVVWNTKPE